MTKAVSIPQSSTSRSECALVYYLQLATNTHQWKACAEPRSREPDILKQAPLAVLRICEVLEAVLPKDVIQVVLGVGIEVPQVLTTHPLV